MKCFILLLLSLLPEYSNKKTKHPDASYSTHFEFSFQDSEGRDLLDPAITGSFDHNQIKFFTRINGVETVILDHTDPIFISNERGYYTLHCNTNTDTCYIKLSEIITDTITTEWKGGSNYLYNTKMWYNGELKWEKDKTDFPILIVK